MTQRPAPVAASPELSARPRRRSFTAQDKRPILAETDRAAATGRIGAILRREGLYSSNLTAWRRQRDAAAIGGLAPDRRGPKRTEPNPLATELARLQQDNARPAGAAPAATSACRRRAGAVISPATAPSP